jgi:uncharacterized membrane protein
MEGQEVTSAASARMIEIATWLALALFLVVVIGFAWNPGPFGQALAATGISAAILHSCLTYGWKRASTLLAICLVVSFAMENLSSVTGFPFGHYHFVVGDWMPHIGTIPIIVGFLWFGMGYFSWIVAATLLDHADMRLREDGNLFVLPIISAFVMTQWDLVMDPPMATIFRAWVWHDGGADFGVPMSNFAGWFLTSWLFFQLFAFILSLRAPRSPIVREPILRLTAIILYVAPGLTHIVPWLTQQPRAVADAAGHVWQANDIRSTTVVTMALTMAFTATLALMRLTRKWK